MNSKRFFSLSSILTAFVLLIVGASLVLAASAPMRVASEGLTVEEQLAAQADLSSRLLKDLPSNATAVKIPFTADEAAIVDAMKATCSAKNWSGEGDHSAHQSSRNQWYRLGCSF